jgi:hypothetical protein
VPGVRRQTPSEHVPTPLQTFASLSHGVSFGLGVVVQAAVCALHDGVAHELGVLQVR